MYYPPSGWFAYGIKVAGKYDNGNDDWLDIPTWATSYHCVRAPTATNPLYISVSQSKGQTVTRSIMEKGLIQGQNQAYEMCDAIGGGKVGKGIYSTPHIKEAEVYAGQFEIGPKMFKMGFMCRVNPSMTMKPISNPNYWITKNTESIRPYKLIIKETPLMSYNTSISSQCSYSSTINTYNSNLYYQECTRYNNCGSQNNSNQKYINEGRCPDCKNVYLNQVDRVYCQCGTVLKYGYYSK